MTPADNLNGWLWLVGSLLLSVATWQLLSRLERSESRPPWAASLLNWVYTSDLVHLLRFVYHVCVPFVALIWGHDVVVGRLLGLQPFSFVGLLSGQSSAHTAENWGDWIRDLGWAFGLATATGVTIAIGWRIVNKYSKTHPPYLPSGPLGSLREALFHEVHWAFYRNAPSILFGTYYGAWAGLALVALEGMLNPIWRKSLSSLDDAPFGLLRVGMAVLSTLMFIQTQNLFLAIAAHWLLTWALENWMAPEAAHE